MRSFVKVGLKLQFAIVFMAAMVCSSLQTEGKDSPFSRIVVCGDSLSDTGNFFRLSGGFPPPPYFEGRACDGKLWVEYLARGLGMEILPGDNHAVFGATTGSFNLNNGLNGRDYPGLEQQIDEILAGSPDGLDPKALYIVWAGANDIFLALETGGDLGAAVQNGVLNTVAAIQKLYAAGARHIMVPNMPDLGITPALLESGAAPLITALAAGYNDALENALGQTEIPILELDTSQVFQGMVRYRRLLGFRNVTDAYLDTMEGNVRHYLFWDSAHPTTRAHQILAVVAIFELADQLNHRERRGVFNLLRAVGQ